MKTVLVEMFDEVSQQHSVPMTFNNEASAIRYLRSKAKDPLTKDIKLYKIGVYDTETGVIEALAPELIVRGDALINEEEK